MAYEMDEKSDGLVPLSDKKFILEMDDSYVEKIEEINEEGKIKRY